MKRFETVASETLIMKENKHTKSKITHSIQPANLLNKGDKTGDVECQVDYTIANLLEDYSSLTVGLDVVVKDVDFTNKSYKECVKELLIQLKWLVYNGINIIAVGMGRPPVFGLDLYANNTTPLLSNALVDISISISMKFSNMLRERDSVLHATRLKKTNVKLNDDIKEVIGHTLQDNVPVIVEGLNNVREAFGLSPIFEVEQNG